MQHSTRPAADRSQCKSPLCRQHHPSFNLDAGDRAAKTWLEAFGKALGRIQARGPQRVVRHQGPFFRRGVWFVQDRQVGA